MRTCRLAPFVKRVQVFVFSRPHELRLKGVVPQQNVQRGDILGEFLKRVQGLRQLRLGQR